MFSWKVGILDDQFPNALQAVVEARRDVRHLSLRGGVARDVVVNRDVGRSIAGMHGEIRFVPVRQVVPKQEVNGLGLC